MMETVECRSDPQSLTEYAERPLSLVWQGRRHEIAEIISRWRGPGEKGFRVKTTKGMAFELTYQEVSDDWHVQPI
jgi:hypothetical protein